MQNAKKLYCYSHEEFDSLMEKMGWENRPDNGNSTISITSKADENPHHWFNVELNNNINIEFNDVSPMTWWDKDYYDDAYEAWINNMDIVKFFDFVNTNIYIHAMDYEDAARLVAFIDERVKAGDNIYVHCSAGVSRSQAIVRYILDTYPDINWETRPENPCITPNYHVVMMLKRIHRLLEF